MTPDNYKGTLKYDEPLSRYTSWRVGGKANRFYIPKNLDDLVAFLKSPTAVPPIYFIGLGSNLLVRDGGVRGTVILTHGSLNDLEAQEDLLYAEAGVTCHKLARASIKYGKQGGEFLAGIPGTVGGALAMNAGCYNGETWSFVDRVLFMNVAGNVYERSSRDFKIAYRHVILPEKGWFLGAWFRFQDGISELSKQKMKILLAKRIETQPLNLPNAGSTFRNPPNHFSAKLIEDCGLKGVCIGNMQISEKHANFIVNLGRGTARDVEALMTLMQNAVKEKFNITLIPEVQIIGESV